MAKKLRAALYARISTTGQTVENSGTCALSQGATVGKGGGHVQRLSNQRARGREGRPGLENLLQAVARRDVDLVAVWSVDRLGRSLQDLLGVPGEIHAKGCELYIHQQGIDTRTPAGKALFQMMGVFTEFERAIIVERVKSGLKRAKAQGKRLGRPRKNDPALVADIGRLRAEGMGINRVARTLGVGSSYVQRIIAEHQDRASGP
jgi:DNA invertase Pin-like site-specific DNA recombinase